MSITNHILQNGITLGTAKVVSNDIRTAGSAVPGRTLQSIGYVTLHNTGLVDVKANNFHRALKNENSAKNGRQASWTFTVDDVEIYQETKINWETWHAGNSTGNKNSISIEMCMWSDKEKQRKTYENSAILVAKLLKEYKLDISKVVQHNKWSGKDCPQYLRSNKHGYDWNWFISRVQYHLNGGDASATTVIAQKGVTTDNLNLRKSDNTSATIITTIPKGTTIDLIGKTANGWYKVEYKGSTGYVSGSYVTVTVTNTNSTKFEVGAYNDFVIITADSLNCRSGRGIEFPLLGSFKKNEKVGVWYIAKAKDGSLWGSCSCNGKTGYINVGYTKKA